MHPAPTELDKIRQPRKRIRPSIAYLAAFGLWLFADRLATSAIRDEKAWAFWLPTSIVAGAAMAYGLWRSERDVMQSEDELEQKVRTEALAAAFPVAIGVGLVLGRLQQAHADLIDPSMYWVVLTLPYWIVRYFVRRRYGLVTPVR